MALLATSMTSISPLAAHVPCLPQPLQEAELPSSGSSQKAGHSPRPWGTLMRASMRMVLVAVGTTANLPAVRTRAEVKGWPRMALAAGS